MGIAMGFSDGILLAHPAEVYELTIQNGGFMDVHEDIHHSIGIESLNELI